MCPITFIRALSKTAGCLNGQVYSHCRLLHWKKPYTLFNSLTHYNGSITNKQLSFSKTVSNQRTDTTHIATVSNQRTAITSNPQCPIREQLSLPKLLRPIRDHCSLLSNQDTIPAFIITLTNQTFLSIPQRHSDQSCEQLLMFLWRIRVL